MDDSVKKSGQAGTENQGQEIEVAPEMIDVVLDWLGDGRDQRTTCRYSAELLLREVLALSRRH